MPDIMDILKYIWAGSQNQQPTGGQNPIEPYLTPGYNGQPNPAGQIGQRSQMNGQQQMLQQQAMGQSGGIKGLLQNPEFLKSLAQIAMSQGKYGGARGQGFADQNNINRQLQQQQSQAADTSARDWKRIEQEDADIEDRRTTRKTATTAQVLDTARSLGIPAVEAAKIYGTEIDPALAEKFDAAIKAKSEANKSYVDLDENSKTFGTILAQPDPDNPNHYGMDTKRALELSKALTGKDKKTRFYIGPNGKPISETLVANMPTEVRAALEGPYEASEAISRAGQINKPEATSVAALTERALAGDAKAKQMLDSMEQRDIRIGTGKAVSYSGQEQPTYDASGKLTGTLNKATNKWEAVPGGMPDSYNSTSPSLPGTTMERIEGLKTSIDLTKDVIPRLTSKASFGPAAGRITLAEIEKLGGLGASKEDIELATDLKRIVTTQAFANGGKQLTITELEQFEKLNPKLTDTLDTALIKTKKSMEFLRLKLKNTVDTLSPRQRGILNPNFTNDTGQGATGGSTGNAAADEYLNKKGKL